MLAMALIYLVAALISVPIAKRLGLGSVLGYILAGVIIGPFALKLVGDQADVMHFAEFGVVMMLFLIGLELRPSRLWELRRPILGLGGLQVVFTTLVFTAAILLVTPQAWQSALAIGLALTLSSTAIVLQSLTERGWLKTQAGNNAFSVLLFQDIAVIPALALLPILTVSSIGGITSKEESHNLISDLSVIAQVAVSVGTVIFIVVGGKFLSAPAFKYIANTRIREIFTAFALTIVIAIEVLMKAIGLSPALGAFLAGVVLADSQFRHELEVDIEPFKALFLGLFFITVGASIDFNLLQQNPGFIALSVLALFAVKASVLALLARGFKMDFSQGLLFTLALAQGGEFAFVIVSAAKQFSVLDTTTSNTVILIVALSMLISPLLLVLYEKIMSRPSQKATEVEEEKDIQTGQAIIAGYGRFGQIVGRLLTAQGYKLTILDHSPSQVELVRRFGSTVYYGDASRKELLHVAGAESANLLVIAVDEPDKTIDIIHTVQKNFPNLKILARTFDRRHSYELMKLGIAGFKRETFDSALNMGTMALELMGQSKDTAKRAAELFEQHDMETLEQLANVWGDDQSYGVAVRQRTEDLRQVLQSDQDNSKNSTTQK